MLFWIIVAVVVLLYGLIAYMGARSWQIGHVILMFGVFLMGGLYLFLAAMTLKTEHQWRSVHDRLAKELETAETELAQINKGDLSRPDADLNSIPGVRNALTRALANRGRIWRGAVPAGVADGQFTLNMQGWGDEACARAGLAVEQVPPATEAPPAEGGAATTPQPVAAQPHEIKAGTLLFAFAEVNPEANVVAILYGDSELPARDEKKVCKLPGAYLGRFLVSEANEQTIRLAPVYRPDASQEKLLQLPLTWTLYESMPKDSHEIFAGWTAEQLQAVFTGPEGVDPTEWQTMLQEYARDGSNAQPGDPDDRKWIKVRFTQDATVDVDTAAEEISFDRPFDPSGRAALPDLRQGGPTEFKKGNEATFSFATAQALVRDGKAERLEESPVFHRPLRDFDLMLHQRHVQLESQQQLLQVATGDQDSIRIATEKAQGQIQARTVELDKLGKDLAQYKKELTVIGSVWTQLNARRQAQRSELSRLFQSNIGLRGQLATRG